MFVVLIILSTFEIQMLIKKIVHLQDLSREDFPIEIYLIIFKKVVNSHIVKLIF